ncbi:MAG: flagellar hook-length control protein FliK [Nitrospirota bacterium]|nr:flagellar hook-length control protein FliK [Nitrospirota bacterium]
MVPFPLQPSFILSAPVRLDGQPNLESLLIPGEAIRATVLNMQDDGSLLLVIKGATLSAASLVGPLPAGTVVEAHVELKDGQVLLRLDRPQEASSAIPIGTDAADPPAASRPGGLGGAPSAMALLKTLLPADQPLASGLAALTASLSAAAERGALAPQTVTRFETLVQTILLAPDQLDAPITGERIRGALLALGVQHEQALLSEWSKTGTLAGQGQAPNLKALLLALLTEMTADGREERPPLVAANSPEPSVSPMLPAAVAASPLYDVALVRNRATSLSSGGAAPQEPAGAAPLSSEQAVVRSEGRVVVPLQVATEGASQAQMRIATTKLPPIKLPPVQPMPARQVEPSAGHAPVQAQSSQARDIPEQIGAGAGPSSEAQPPPSHGEGAVQVDNQGRPAKAGPGALAARAIPPVKAGAVTPAAAPEEESAEPTDAPSALGQSGPEASEKGGWIRDAQQVLTLIERTQALALLNAQTGQPIPFELPLAGGGQVRVYVDERTSSGGQHQEAPRTCHVVTLLTLDGLGPVRVDTALTGKRLSARFLLDQTDVRQRVAGYLPALNSSLSAKGYQVEVLATDLGEPQQMRGDDVRARAVPRVSLVSRRA